MGFLLSGGTFLLLSKTLTDQQFFSFGWRLPFLASAALVLVGLWIRLEIHETPVFREMLNRSGPVRAPIFAAVHKHARQLIAGILLCLATFVLFYLMTVFALSWGTTALGYGRGQFLEMQLFGILFFAATIPVSAILAERGRKATMMVITAAIFLFGLVFAPMFSAGLTGAMGTMASGSA